MSGRKHVLYEVGASVGTVVGSRSWIGACGLVIVPLWSGSGDWSWVFGATCPELLCGRGLVMEADGHEGEARATSY